MNPNDIQEWVSVKQFQQNIYGYLDKLPIVVTKHGKPFGIFLPAQRPNAGQVSGRPERPIVKPIMGIKPVEEVISEFQEEKKVDVCEHGRMRGLCEHGCR
jgi:hypothetical protein